MSIRSILSCLLLLAVSVSCSRDPNVIKARYLQNGNKYFERGKYKEASIMYRTALQKDAKYGEAYYRLALTDLKTKQPYAAVMSFRRAVELLKPDQMRASSWPTSIWTTWRQRRNGMRRSSTKSIARRTISSRPIRSRSMDTDCEGGWPSYGRRTPHRRRTRPR